MKIKSHRMRANLIKYLTRFDENLYHTASFIEHLNKISKSITFRSQLNTNTFDTANLIEPNTSQDVLLMQTRHCVSCCPTSAPKAISIVFGPRMLSARTQM